MNISSLQFPTLSWSKTSTKQRIPKSGAKSKLSLKTEKKKKNKRWKSDERLLDEVIKLTNAGMAKCFLNSTSPIPRLDCQSSNFTKLYFSVFQNG